MILYCYSIAYRRQKIIIIKKLLYNYVEHIKLLIALRAKHFSDIEPLNIIVLVPIRDEMIEGWKNDEAAILKKSKPDDGMYMY